MIGLQGKGVAEKLKIYFDQMSAAFKEMRRVSKKGSPIIIIVGSNSVQTGGLKLESKIIELATKQNLRFDFELVKPIRGLQNTMKNESILFFTNLK